MTTGLEAGPRSVQTFRVYVDRRKRWHSLKIGIDARGRGGRTNDPKRHVAAPARAHPRRKRLLAESPHRRSLHARTRLRLCQYHRASRGHGRGGASEHPRRRLVHQLRCGGSFRPENRDGLSPQFSGVPVTPPSFFRAGRNRRRQLHGASGMVIEETSLCSCPFYWLRDWQRPIRSRRLRPPPDRLRLRLPRRRSARSASRSSRRAAASTTSRSACGWLWRHA